MRMNPARLAKYCLIHDVSAEIDGDHGMARVVCNRSGCVINYIILEL